MTNKKLILEIAKNYKYYNAILLEVEKGCSYASQEKISQAKKYVDHINHMINILDDNDKFIILNEVVNGKKSTWYDCYLSTPTYYRHASKAYRNFLLIIK